MWNRGHYVRVIIAGWALALAGVAPVAAQKQEEKDHSQSVFGGSPLFWNVPKILDAWVAQVTKYYELDEDQEEFTRQLLTQRVKRFLGEHEQDVRKLMAEYIGYRISQRMPTPEAAKEFSRQAGPLMNRIRQEIFDGNTEWAEILNEEQKKIHDRDLQGMTRFFDYFEGAIERWSRGDVRPIDVGRVSDSPRRALQTEDSWGVYVRHFIRSYQLDDGQQQTAYSILRELRADAKRYRDANKQNFDRYESDRKRLYSNTPRTNPADLREYREQVIELEKRWKELERPVTSLYNQLRTRLEGVPTSDQRHAHNKEMARLSRHSPLRKGDTGTRPAGASTHPASTQPATTKPSEVAAKP